jgi:hypothetical protein
MINVVSTAVSAKGVASPTPPTSRGMGKAEESAMPFAPVLDGMLKRGEDTPSPSQKGGSETSKKEEQRADPTEPACTGISLALLAVPFSEGVPVCPKPSKTSAGDSFDLITQISSGASASNISLTDSSTEDTKRAIPAEKKQPPSIPTLGASPDWPGDPEPMMGSSQHQSLWASRGSGVSLVGVSLDADIPAGIMAKPPLTFTGNPVPTQTLPEGGGPTLERPNSPLHSDKPPLPGFPASEIPEDLPGDDRVGTPAGYQDSDAPISASKTGREGLPDLVQRLLTRPSPQRQDENVAAPPQSQNESASVRNLPEGSIRNGSSANGIAEGLSGVFPAANAQISKILAPSRHEPTVIPQATLEHQAENLQKGDARHHSEAKADGSANAVTAASDDMNSQLDQRPKPSDGFMAPQSLSLHQDENLATPSMAAETLAGNHSVPNATHQEPESLTQLGSHPNTPELSLPASYNTAENARADLAGSSATARLLERLSGTEMHVAFHSDTLGSIDLHAVARNETVGAIIGVASGEVKSFLTTHLPSLEQALKDHNLQADRIVISDSSTASGMEFSSNADARSSSFGQPRQTLAPSTHHDGTSPDPSSQEATAETTGLLRESQGLNLHV